MKDFYTTLVQPSEGFFKDRGSKFLAYAYPVFDDETIKEHLLTLKKLHPKVRHICYAYRLGLDKNNYRANDDGEPSGTAGKPILGQIDSFGLSNVLIAVVRYFGGTKLGVGGLINAYRTSALEALNVASLEERTINNVYQIQLGYDSMTAVMRFLKQEQINIVDQIFDATVCIEVSIRQSESDIFLSKWKEQSLNLGLSEVVKVNFLKVQ